jgi:PAS domain S-box-containing protein
MTITAELPASRKETLLLVDDNPINLIILEKTLANSGYRMLTADNGEEALRLVEQHHPALILLDILMPGMDGFQVCEKIKANEETRDCAVIFLSALEDSSSKLKGFEVGGVDYISKPFQANEVVARVKNHTKIRRLESELARRNEELEEENYQVLHAISEGVIALDENGFITMLNPAASLITGWSEVDALGEKLIALGVFDNDVVRAREETSLPFRSYKLGKRSHSDMEMIRRKDGLLLPVAMTCSPRRDGGAVVVVHDISEWVESEEALRFAREQLESQRQHMAHMERLNTTGEMAAGIAHEVNQPLTAIANYSRVAIRLLEQDELPRDKLKEILEKMDVQSERASAVIARMRGYVKKTDTGRELIDPNKLIQDVIDLAEVDSRKNDVIVSFKSVANLPKVSIDVVQIQQVALNLIRNAMEAMGASALHEKEVEVSTEVSGKQVLIKVRDFGPGIDKEAEARLFDPFFSTKQGGMGVGLSICQSIIQAHGGELGFHRNIGKGVTFYFSLAIAD